MVKKQRHINSPEKSPQKLWESHLNGCDDAIDELYTHLFPKLLMYAYSKVRNESEAKDLVQDAFLFLIEKSDGQSITHVEGWLKKRIGYLILEKFRKEGIQAKYQETTKIRSLPHTYLKPTFDLKKLEEGIVNILNDLNAQIFQMDRDGFSNEEIAECLGISKKKVEVRKSASKKKLSERLSYFK